MGLSDTGLAALPHSRGRLFSPPHKLPQTPPVTSEFHTGAFHRCADAALRRVYGTNSWLGLHPCLGGIPKSTVKVITFTPPHIRACLWSAFIKTTFSANMQLFNECVSPRQPTQMPVLQEEQRFHPYRSEISSGKLRWKKERLTKQEPMQHIQSIWDGAWKCSTNDPQICSWPWHRTMCTL